MTFGIGGTPMGLTNMSQGLVGGVYPPLSPVSSRLFYNGIGAVQKGRPRKRKCPSDDMQPLTPLPPGLGMILYDTLKQRHTMWVKIAFGNAVLIGNKRANFGRYPSTYAIERPWHVCCCFCDMANSKFQLILIL